MQVSVAIMAAGFGTRMKSSAPKVLHSISGAPMLYHIIKEAQKISDDIHVILYHEAQKIQDTLNTYFENITYILQDHANFPGTGGALMGLGVKNKRVLVLNGDMPLVRAKDMRLFLEPNEKVIMSSFSAKNPFGYGRVVMDENKIVLKIVEEKDANEDEKKITSVNAGVYLFDTQFLRENLPKLSNQNSQKEYYLTDLIAIANKQNIAVRSLEIDEETFMGVNSKVHLALAEEYMQRRIKIKFMQDGVIMRLADTIYIEHAVQIEGESIIENGVCLLGDTKIINAHIKAHSVIENSTIIDSDVGPMARIRPQSLLQNTHIGNFVEVKNAKLTGVKAGHLSYLGDCEIDEGTNVGCGTITCNYDGKNKYKTIIGKNVFIGSDSQLVAPVRIGDDVLIASGTTVTRDIPKGALAINRAPLQIKDNFFYKFFGKPNATK